MLLERFCTRFFFFFPVHGDQGTDLTFSHLFFSSGSCGYNFKDRQGNLTSPNYPFSYPNNLNCLWTITATPGDYIYLYFTYFYVQGYNYYWWYGRYGNYGYNSYCPYDYVEVFDLNYPSSFIKVRGCGYQSPWCVKSKSQVMHIRFVTNSIYSFTGFTANYTVYRTPPVGDNCLSLNPYASSSTIFSTTPSKLWFIVEFSYRFLVTCLLICMTLF